MSPRDPTLLAPVATWGGASVSHDSPVPLYRQIEGAIARLIDSGEMSPHSALPSEAKLSELYGVSRLTVRQALGELRRKGLVESHQGKGTFVAAPARSDVTCLSSFTETALRSGHTPRSQMISFGEVMDVAMARHLNQDERMPLIQVVRLRLLDDTPAFLSIASIPLLVGQSLAVDDFPALGLRQSLYQTLERCCGVHLRHGEEEVSATLATKSVAQLLGVKYRAPLVARTCTMFAAKGHPAISERTLWAQPQTSSVRLVWSGTR